MLTRCSSSGCDSSASTGLSDNWDQEMAFLRDIADGLADGIAGEPRPDLVRFVTMQELSDRYDALAQATSR